NDNPAAVDPITDTMWTGGFFLNDGNNASGLVYEYHVATDTWEQGPPLPKGIGAGQMAVVGRELHYWGGRDRQNHGSVLHWHLNLDDQSAGWIDDTPMPVTANHNAAVVLGGKMYSIGGIIDKLENSSKETSVLVYDPATRLRTTVPPRPFGN